MNKLIYNQNQEISRNIDLTNQRRDRCLRLSEIMVDLTKNPKQKNDWIDQKYFLTLNGNCAEFTNFIKHYNKINNSVKINIDDINRINYIHTDIDTQKNVITYHLKDIDITTI
jgi:hypothetical protein